MEVGRMQAGKPGAVTRSGGANMRKWMVRVLWGLVAMLVMGQLIRPTKMNPPVAAGGEIQAQMAVDPAVDAIFSRSCNDCHSNNTVWPWYSNVAPVSWLVWWDVKQGRRELNFSEWASYTPKRVAKKLDETCKELTESEMPPVIYTITHTDAKLSVADVETVCRWTKAAGKIGESAGAN